MLVTHKYYFLIFLLLLSSPLVISEENPYIFIDKNAQIMVKVLEKNKNLFLEDRDAYENKIKEIFDPMINFRLVASNVMGRKHYFAASKIQREEFVEIFKDSLLDNYAETLAEFENLTVITDFPEVSDYDTSKNITVNQTLNTGSSGYPIVYKLRKNTDNKWLIINIIVQGVNLGTNFRNQFQVLANYNNGDIQKTLDGWVLDVEGTGLSG